MLPRKERLTSKMFDRSFHTGQRSNCNLWQIVYTPTLTAGFQAAVVVGKKVDKSAVKRNKLRRQVYNLLYRYQQTHKIKGVYLILTKPTIKTATFAEVKEQLHSSFNLIEKKTRAG